MIVQYTTTGTAIRCYNANNTYNFTGCQGGRLVDGGYYRIDKESDFGVRLEDLDGNVINIDDAEGATGTHTLTRASFKGIGLTDGRTYYVQTEAGDEISLWTKPTGEAGRAQVSLFETTTFPELVIPADPDPPFWQLGSITIAGQHRFVEVVGLHSAIPTGTTHRLVVDLTADGDGRFAGVGGPSAFMGNYDDGVSTANSSGFGIGGVNVRTSTSSASSTVSVTTTVGGTLRANDVIIEADAIAALSAISATAGGGFIDVGDSYASAVISNTAVTTVTANIVSAEDVRITSAAFEYANVKSDTDGGGAIAFADGRSKLHVTHNSTTTISGRVYAFRTVLANAAHGVNLTANAAGHGGGLGVDAEANDDGDEDTQITGDTRVVLTPTARVIGANVYLWATGGRQYDITGSGSIAEIAANERTVTGYRAYQRAHSRGAAVGGDSDAQARIYVTELIEVFLDRSDSNAAEITVRRSRRPACPDPELLARGQRDGEVQLRLR